MRGRAFWVLSSVAALVCTAVLFGQGVAVAQTGDGGWSPPVLLFKVSGTTDRVIGSPIVVAGEDGSVHVFWQYDVPEDANHSAHAAIDYTRWDGKSWSKPVDLVDAPTLHLSSAAIDRNGYLHLMWQGALARLFYARAWEGDATSASKWTSPVPVDMGYVNGEIVADSRGWLHRVYARPGHLGPYYQVSKDGGNSWSFPVNVARTSNVNSGADWVRLAVSDNGTLHLVWTEFALPNGWPPAGVYYSRSEDGGKTWSTAVKFAGYGYDQINVATAGNNMVHVAWNGMVGIGGKYHRWSPDGGRTWSDTSTIMGGGGTTGPPQLALDSAGALHVMTGVDQRVWHAVWQNQAWSQPEEVLTGDETGIPPLGTQISEQTRQIEQITMAISNGNQLHAVFWDVRRKDRVNYVWYTSKTVVAPSVPPVSFASPVPASTADRSRSTDRPHPGSSASIAPLPPAVRPSPGALGTTSDPTAAQPALDSRSPAFAGGGLAALLVGGTILLGVIRGGNR